MRLSCQIGVAFGLAWCGSGISVLVVGCEPILCQPTLECVVYAHALGYMHVLNIFIVWWSAWCHSNQCLLGGMSLLVCLLMFTLSLYPSSFPRSPLSLSISVCPSLCPLSVQPRILTEPRWVYTLALILCPPPDICCTWMFWGSSYVLVASMLLFIYRDPSVCIVGVAVDWLLVATCLSCAAAATDWEGAQGRVGHNGSQPQGHSPESSPTFLQQSGRWGSPWYFQEIAFLFHLMFDHLFNHHSTVPQC